MKGKWEVCVLNLGGFVGDQSGISRMVPHGMMTQQNLTCLAATDGKHRVVIDTGFYTIEGIRLPGIHQTEEEKLPYLLKTYMGWDPADVDIVINTHLHCDHCGGNHLFPKATFYVQKREWEAANDPTPYERDNYHPYMYDKHMISYFRWHFSDGDELILPGLMVLLTPGHTRGSQSVLLETAEGVLCFAGDTITCRLNLEKGLTPSIISNDVEIYQSIERIKMTATHIVFGHEGEQETGMRTGFCKVPDHTIIPMPKLDF